MENSEKVHHAAPVLHPESSEFSIINPICTNKLYFGIIK